MILTAVIALAGALYLRRIPRVAVWRAGSFFLGLAAVWVAVASPVASMDSNMLTAHMIQHLLLMTIAPPLIWMGEPFTLRRGALIVHPVFCWLAAAAALVVWHVPAILRLGMESPVWHFIEHASFLTAGLLFWWPVFQPGPRWSMLLYLFLATLPCDVLSGLLVFSDRVAYPIYVCTPARAGLSPLEDQQCAAALMWTCVTVVFLLAGTILSAQMLSPRREAVPL